MKNLLKNSKAYYEDNDYYEIFSIAEDSECKVANYIKELVNSKIVVDAGCGTGKFLPIIEQYANQYIGIDLSNNQLKKAQEKSLKSNSLFINSTLDNIDLKSNSVDIIISTWVLGTITDLNERLSCLNELKRILKSNGQIILVENDLNSEFEIIRNRDKDTRTIDYNNWLIDNGFKVDKKIDTFFNFNSAEEAIKCFDVIYGSNIAQKINSNKIEHKIIIFKFIK